MLIKQVFGFAGWNFLGASSGVLRDQGVNVLLNIFCGPAVNAARGIAMQVNAAVNSFVNNFMIALNPQITKSYASGVSGLSDEFGLSRLSIFFLFVVASLLTDFAGNSCVVETVAWSCSGSYRGVCPFNIVICVE